MKRAAFLSGTAALALWLCAGAAAQNAESPWPEGKRAAVSLTFDDARPSQIDTGLPLLEKLGVRATFFVSPNNLEKRLEGWKRAAAQGHEIGKPGEAVSGILVIKQPWPGQSRTIWGDHQRYMDTYFSMFKGYYFTGDGARRDEDGYYWITGRVDDVINVSGHRLGTAEVESALVSHPAVAEAAVVGFPHELKGQGIYAYVTLKAEYANRYYDEALKKELVAHVRKEIGPIATPDVIHWAPGLPKTRSGKIMRRILRKVAEGDLSNLGDTTTLADPSVVQKLIEDKGK